jgi:hypothetical protein
VNADTLPCGCSIASSLFENTAGARVLITVPPAESGFADDVPGAVWCVQCFGWQHAPADEVARFAEVVA